MGGKRRQRLIPPLTLSGDELREAMNARMEEQNRLSMPAIPEDERSRQAVPSLRGYAYQLYQSLAAWLSLNSDEALLLEVAEDFAILARGALNGTQVKDTAASGSVTLRSKSVCDALQSVCASNRQIHIRLSISTTSQHPELDGRKCSGFLTIIQASPTGVWRHVRDLICYPCGGHC